MTFGSLRPGHATTAEMAAQMSRLESENQRLNSENQRLSSQVNEAISQRNTARAEAEALRVRLNQGTSEYAGDLPRHRQFGVNNHAGYWMNQNIDPSILQPNDSFALSPANAPTAPTVNHPYLHQSPAVNMTATLLSQQTTSMFDFEAGIVSSGPYAFEHITQDPVAPSGALNPMQLQVRSRSEASSRSERATLVNEGQWTNTTPGNQSKIPLQGDYMSGPNDNVGWTR